MKVFLTEKNNNKNRLLFPTAPESIKCRGAALYQTYNIISAGTVKVGAGTDITTVSVAGTFFGKKRKKSAIISEKFITPKKIRQTLEKWRNKNTIINLLISGTSINYDVTIDTIDLSESGAHGDLEYSIVFSCHRELLIRTVAEMGKKSASSKRAGGGAGGGNYTVVKGDTLWRIAQRKLGKGSRYTEIYNLNKKVIEDTAKKYRKSSQNGHWIYPGTVLIIPSKNSVVSAELVDVKKPTPLAIKTTSKESVR